MSGALSAVDQKVRWTAPAALAASAAVFVVGVPLVAAVLFFPVILLAGPHSDLLPGSLQGLVLIAGWATVFGLPGWLAFKLFRRLRPAA